MVGGYCSTFRRGGYTFDAATHFYPLLGNPETLTGRLLARARRPTPAGSRWTRSTPSTSRTARASPCRPTSTPTWRKLKAEFPTEAAALDEFFARGARGLSPRPAALFPRPAAGQLERLAPWRDLTVRAGARPLLPPIPSSSSCSPPTARTGARRRAAPRSSSTPCCGSPTSSATTIPQGGSQAFADELAALLRGARRAHPDRARWRRRILIEDGPRRGVELEIAARRAARAAAVHGARRRRGLERRPAADPGAAGRAGAPAEPGALEPLRRLRPTYPCFLTHLGLRGRAGRRPRSRPRATTGTAGTWTAWARRPALQDLRADPLRARPWRRRAGRSSSSRRCWRWTTTRSTTGRRTRRRIERFVLDHLERRDPRDRGADRGQHQRLGAHLLALHAQPAGRHAGLGDVARAARRRPARHQRARSPTSSSSATGRGPAAASRR